jgi:predicted  nucleic acid-binding Zn-ribbon protein
VVDFVDQFTQLESENVQLHKAVKASVDQVLEANKLAAEAQSENICLKDELRKLKKKMKDEQEARHKAFIEADEKEGALRESIASLLSKFPSYLYDTSSEYFPDAMNCFFIIF